MYSHKTPLNNRGREASKTHMKVDVKGDAQPCLPNYGTGASLKRASSLYKTLERKPTPEPAKHPCADGLRCVCLMQGLEGEVTLHSTSLMNSQPGI